MSQASGVLEKQARKDRGIEAYCSTHVTMELSHIINHVTAPELIHKKIHVLDPCLALHNNPATS